MKFGKMKRSGKPTGSPSGNSSAIVLEPPEMRRIDPDFKLSTWLDKLSADQRLEFDHLVSSRLADSCRHRDKQERNK